MNPFRPAQVTAALALSLFGMQSFAQTPITYKCLCQNIGTVPQEPLGDREGHAVWVTPYTCRVEGGPLDGGVLTGTTIYEWDKTSAIGLSGNGVGRKAGGMVVYQLGEFKNALTMADGKVTGFLGSGQGTYKMATGGRRIIGWQELHVCGPARWRESICDRRQDRVTLSRWATLAQSSCDCSFSFICPV